MALLRLTARFLRPYTGLVVLALALQTVQAVAQLLLPTLNAAIIDDGVVAGDVGVILGTGGIMLAVTVLQVAAAIAAVWFGAKSAMRMGRDLRAAVFDRVAAFSEQEVSAFGAPSLITRTTNDVQQIQQLVFTVFAMIVSAPLTAVGGIVMAAQLDPGLTWILAVAAPLLLVVIGLVIARMVPQFQAMQERIDRITRVIREQLAGIRVIRAFVRERHETERYRDANERLTRAALKAGWWMALAFPAAMLIMNVGSVAVLWFGAHEVDAGRMNVGAVMAFLQYLIQILMAVTMATMMAMMVPRAAVSSTRIAEVLATEPTVLPPAAPIAPDGAFGRVEFRDAVFRYPGADVPVLDGVSFTAAPGTTTAIVGATGSGKTTLVGLIPRLFDVTAGAVLVDGVDVRDLEPDELWARIAMVPQRAYLFSGTVATNLRFGAPGAGDDELWAALETAQAAEFVRRMPGGLEAPIAQGGTNVSGGQRQRLAIARALVKRAPVLVFDDAFSALDSATDQALRAALARDAPQATRIVVAQRVSTILDADEILVLDDGVVRARGTHEQLLARSETYREIVASQLSPEDVA